VVQCITTNLLHPASVLQSRKLHRFAHLQVLQDLIEEDERVIETWYLFAMCLHAGGEHGEAASAVERGQALAKTLGMPADDPLVLAFADTKVGGSVCTSISGSLR
jgi:hypothetical protein